MTPTAACLVEAIRLEFGLACVQLAEAKAAQRTKDTRAARAGVVACQNMVDAILDMGTAAGRMRS